MAYEETEEVSIDIYQDSRQKLHKQTNKMQSCFGEYM